MSRPLHLTQWQQELKGRFRELPTHVVFVLAVYSVGMIMAHASGLSAVAFTLSEAFAWSYHAVRKRLSEFYKEAPAKSGFKQGSKRTDFDVSTCFCPMLKWILSLWSGRHLALAIDVTNFGERFHVLCISVVIHGGAIPVAWKVLYGGMKDPWNPHWRALLKHLKKAVTDHPDEWLVIVLSDRGLESTDLFEAIKEQGWHPMMRAKKGGKFRPKGWGQFHFFSDLVRQVGGTFYSEGRAYTGKEMPCTLLACWQDGYDEPWLILTDLPPEAANAVWYALRGWIEQGFKVIKSGGWDWEKTRMEDPARVERFWLVMAVATRWVMAVGAEDEVMEKLKEDLKKLEKEMTESLQQAQQRQERERKRMEQHRQALAARKARKEKQEAARQQQREESRKKKKAKKSETKEENAAAAGPPATTTSTTATAQAKKVKPRMRSKKAEGTPVRIHRVSTRGLAVLNAEWEKEQVRLPRFLRPEPWQEPCHPVNTLSEEDFLSQLT
jgi:DDE family transposase